MNRLTEKQMETLQDYISLNSVAFKGCSRAYIAKTATKDLKFKVNTNNIIRAQKRAGITSMGAGRPSNSPSKEESPLDVQVGADHYKKMKIQPVVFIEANGLSFLEGCIVKRICRWKSKDGIQDLEKIKHEVDLLIELSK